jgi:hypothetical protein
MWSRCDASMAISRSNCRTRWPTSCRYSGSRTQWLPNLALAGQSPSMPIGSARYRITVRLVHPSRWIWRHRLASLPYRFRRLRPQTVRRTIYPRIARPADWLSSEVRASAFARARMVGMAADGFQDFSRGPRPARHGRVAGALGSISMR